MSTGNGARAGAANEHNMHPVVFRQAQQMGLKLAINGAFDLELSSKGIHIIHVLIMIHIDSLVSKPLKLFISHSHDIPKF